MDLHLQRTAIREGLAGNDRGASVRFGPADVEGVFTPGELLAIALAACNLMSADHTIARRVGTDPLDLTSTVTTVKDTAANRYVRADVTLAIGGAAHLDAAAWDDLVARATRAVERSCTVGRSLERELPHTLSIERT